MQSVRINDETIRYKVDDGQPWFVARDVARAVGKQRFWNLSDRLDLMYEHRFWNLGAGPDARFISLRAVKRLTSEISGEKAAEVWSKMDQLGRLLGVGGRQPATESDGLPIALGRWTGHRSPRS